MGLEQLLPWITGPLGALVVSILWTISERKQRIVAEEKYEQIAREAIVCLTKIVSAEEHEKNWRDSVVKLLEFIKDQSLKNSSR